MYAGVEALDQELQALRDRAEKVKQRYINVTAKMAEYRKTQPASA